MLRVPEYTPNERGQVEDGAEEQREGHEELMGGRGKRCASEVARRS